MSKAASQRLKHWRTFLRQYRFTIVHIPGAENNWGDLLSRFRPKQPATMPLRATAVFSDRSTDYPWPTKQTIRETQAMLLDQPGAETPVGLAQRGSDGAYRVVVHSGINCPRDVRRSITCHQNTLGTPSKQTKLPGKTRMGREVST